MTDGVETYGELEVLDFMANQKGLFIDARLANWYAKSAIPTSVNIPFKLFLSDSPERNKILKDLGGEGSGDPPDMTKREAAKAAVAEYATKEDE